jgi:transcriptional regulator with XRE-family HTH domain
MDIQTLAKAIQKERNRKRYSHYRVSQLTGLSIATVKAAESGQDIKASTLIAICKALKVQLAVLDKDFGILAP